MSDVIDQTANDSYNAHVWYGVVPSERTRAIAAEPAPAPLSTAARTAFAPRPRHYHGKHRADVVRLTAFYRRVREMASNASTPLMLASTVRRTGTGWPHTAPSAVEINLAERHASAERSGV